MKPGKDEKDRQDEEVKVQEDVAELRFILCQREHQKHRGDPDRGKPGEKKRNGEPADPVQFHYITFPVQSRCREKSFCPRVLCNETCVPWNDL